MEIPSSVNWGSLEGAGKWFNVPFHQIDIRFSDEEELEIERYCQKIKENIEKDKMTPMERWKATIEGQEVDRFLVEAIPATPYPTRVLDGFGNVIKPIDAFRYPKLFLKSQLAFCARFGTDYPDVYSFTYGESEWGGKAKLLEMAHPVLVEPGVKTMEDVERLKVPNPYRDGQYPLMLWAMHTMKEIFKKHGLAGVVPVVASCCVRGTTMLQLSIRGLKQGYLDPIKNPDIYHKLMPLSNELAINYAKALRDVGVDIVWCCCHHATHPPEVFKEHIAKYDAEFAKKSGIDGWGYAFNQEKHVSIMHEAGGYDTVKYLMFDTLTPPEFARKFTKEINKPYIAIIEDKKLMEGSSKIEEYVKQLIKIGTSAPGVGFGLSAGTIDYWTPPECIDAYVKYAKQYGKLK
jgi:uroporphyrinogen-III decarboxylase